MEALDERTLLAVSFTFNIIDPTNKYKSIRPQLQALLNAAGGEWSTHLLGNASLEYDVVFSETLPPGNALNFATGAAKSAEVIRTDPLTGNAVYQVGTALEVKDGVDRNGDKADGGITIYGPNVGVWFFDPNTNARNAPIPEGYFDGYTILLHELAHSLGFNSARNPLGELPTGIMYTFDQHVSSFTPGFMQFGTFTGVENATQVYGTSVALAIGDPNHLGAGRFINTGIVNPLPIFNQQFVDDLSTDLMSSSLNPGERKTISRLDLAILKDAETPVDLTVDATPQGLYVVNGTGLGDVIDVSSSNSTLLVRVNNSVTSIPPHNPNDPESANITAIIVNGLNGNDIITVTGNAPAVAVNGGAGTDSIYGGTRGDSIFGGGGNDLIFGRGGGDLIRGGDGNDTIYGLGGSDRLFGEAGNDHLDGGVQTDRISGGGNSDTLVGGTEDDFLNGDNGNDVLSGAGGKDRMDGGAGADFFYGGGGNDSVDYSKAGGAVTATIDGSPDDGVAGEGDNIIDTENIIGSSFSDALVGSEGANSLIGGAGNDTLEGGGGHDTLEGNNGVDVLSGGGGHDSLLGGDGNDVIVGGAGLDRIFGGIGDDNIAARDEASDTIDGGDGIDSLVGEQLDDVTAVEIADLGPPLPLPSKPDSALSRKVVFV